MCSLERSFINKISRIDKISVHIFDEKISIKNNDLY